MARRGPAIAASIAAAALGSAAGSRLSDSAASVLATVWVLTAVALGLFLSR